MRRNSEAGPPVRDLGGKRALITGGAGGIGKALARELATKGVRIVVADVDDTAAATFAATLASAGHAATAVGLDVTNGASITAARAALLEDSEPLDILVNNAGVVAGGPFAEVSLAAHQRTTAVNLDGLMAVTHAFLPDLLARPEAHIVNVVSASAFIALPFGTSYAASKWGALGFSESLRHELAALGHQHVGVTAVCPAYVDTGMFAGAKAPPLTRFLTPEALAAATVRAVERRTPVLRLPWTVQLSRLASVLPTRGFDVIARLLGIDTSMRHWRGR